MKICLNFFLKIFVWWEEGSLHDIHYDFLISTFLHPRTLSEMFEPNIQWSLTRKDKRQRGGGDMDAREHEEQAIS